MLLDVFGGRVDAEFWESGALEVKSAKFFAVDLEWALVPVAFDSLPQLGGFFAAPLRVVKHVTLLLTRLIRSINNARVYFEAVARAHHGNYAII